MHFNPRQTLDFLKVGLSSSDISHETRKAIVKQYLHVRICFREFILSLWFNQVIQSTLLSQFKVLMEHLDREEEEEEGEASANARNKAITSLLQGPKPRNHNHNNHKAPIESEDEESEDEDRPAVRKYILYPVLSEILCTV